ncbi:MAG TPA: hypothetical protein VFT96_03860 [Gemmatimonadaceae bacterium]|nr:hypothetical protein [Gemmatimonadaceae bacterium]
MQVSFALFADAANLSQEGKLNILGVFDALQVGGLPSIHPRAHLVVHLKGTPLDAGTHSVSLRWLNPSGQELWQSTGELNVGTPPPGVLEMDLPLIAQIDLPMNEAGAYIMSVSVDGERAAEVPVQVRSLSGAASAPGRAFSGLVS